MQYDAIAILSLRGPLAAASLWPDGLITPMIVALAVFVCLSGAMFVRMRSLQSRLRVLGNELESEKRLDRERRHLVSHKLIGVVNVISGFLSLLRTERGAAMGETEARYLEEIEKGAARGLELAASLSKEDREG